jgi:hypothetical protein
MIRAYYLNYGTPTKYKMKFLLSKLNLGECAAVAFKQYRLSSSSSSSSSSPSSF